LISLRQHIFSLVAVFVALAVGIAAGSTVVRGPLLDSTRARLESAEQNIEIERAENDALAAELAQLDAWEADGPDQLLQGRYAGGAVLMVVAGGVDEDVVDGAIRSIRASAGTFLGEVRLASEVFDPEESARVGEALTPGDAGDADPAIAFGATVGNLVVSVAGQLADGGSARSDEVIRAAFGDLEDAGLVDLLRLNSAEVDVSDLDVVVLTDRNLVQDPARVLDGVVAVSDPTVAGLTVMVAEVGRVLQDNKTPVPSYVATIRDDGRLRDEISTVDNAETILGWVALVLGLEAAEGGSADHYGFREGSDRPIPPRMP
jgi:hypothetical protein